MESLGGLLFPLLILLLFIPIFLSGRKQRRQMQEMQSLQSALEIGDVVTTTSGLRGTVVDASYQDTVDLEIADGVITTWLRAAVRDKVADSGDLSDDTADDTGLVDGPARTDVDGTTAEPRSTTAVEPPLDAPAEPRSTTTAEPPPATPSDANGSHRP
jgi:preprotein translocase subunit YajC